MKPFTKRLALVMGLLFTALICMGIVYIDTVQNYWRVGGTGNGFVQLIVSNKLVMSVSTNTGNIGVGITNQDTSYFLMAGPVPATNAAGNGSTANVSGRIGLTAGVGGSTFDTTSANGGVGGSLLFTGGAGGSARVATVDAAGGNGGTVTFVTGASGAVNVSAATNSITGGNGGNFTMTAASGGSPTINATNTVGGSGGAFTATSGNGGSPSAGWARIGGNAGDLGFNSGNGGTGLRTNAGNGGALLFVAGAAGSATLGGNPGVAGRVELQAGDGANGATNSNGGRIHITGGLPGTGGVPGDVVIGRLPNGTSRGGLQAGPLLGGSATVTNILGAAAALDFPSTAAGTVSDLPITVTGVTSNNCAVALSVAWQGASGGGSFSTYSSNDSVYVRFVNNDLVTAIDPTPFTATVVVFRIR